MKPGRDLDALVAERVMGLQLVKAPKVWSEDDWMTSDTPTETEALGIVNPSWKPGNWSPPFRTIPPYSTDIAAAWEVLRVMHTRTPHLLYVWDAERRFWGVTITTGDDSHVTEYADGWEAAPHAICLAALRAVGVEVPDAP